MKQTITILLITVLSVHLPAQPEGSDKYRTFSIPGNQYPIFGMTLSADQKLMAVSAWNGRTYLVDVKTAGAENLIWKNYDISGFKYGSKPVFSADGKYILMVETVQWTSFWSVVKVKPRKCSVLDAATGKELFSLNGIRSAAFVAGTTHLAVSENDRIRFYDFMTGKKTGDIEVDDIEVLAVSHDGKTIAASYDPEKRELRELESVGKNRGELKNARKSKRLIAFYDVATGKKLATSNDEMDIVIYLEFSPDNEAVIFAVRSKGQEGGTKQLAQFGMGRIDAATGLIDRSFFHYSNDVFLDFQVTNDQKIFAFVDNPGIFGFKKRVTLYDYNNMDSRIAMFGYQGKLFSHNLFSPCFAIRADTTLVYLSNGNRVIEWNYRQLPEYLVYTEPADADVAVDSAQVKLNRELTNGKLKAFIEKNHIRGLFIFDITLHKKGEVATVFAQSDEKTDLMSQNLLKDYLRTMKFDVKLAKNQRVKFKYTFVLESDYDDGEAQTTP